MSDIAAALRAKALAHGTRLRPLNLILDDETRDDITTLTERLAVLRRKRDELAAAGELPQTEADSLADEPQMTPEVDRLIGQVEAAITDAETEAYERGDVLVTNWSRLAPAEYRTLSQKCDREARRESEKPEGRTWSAIFGERLGDQLMQRCYRGAATPDGDTVDLTIDELQEQVLSVGEAARIRDFLIDINTGGDAIAAPFAHRNSGQAATS